MPSPYEIPSDSPYYIPEPRAENLLGSDGSLGGREMLGGHETEMLGGRETEMLGGRETLGGPLGAESNVHEQSSGHSEALLKLWTIRLAVFLASVILNTIRLAKSHFCYP